MPMWPVAMRSLAPFTRPVNREVVSAAAAPLSRFLLSIIGFVLKNGLDSGGQDCPARNNLGFTGSGQTFPGFAGIFIASRITASRPSTPLASIRRRTEGGLRGLAVARVSDVW